MRWLLLKDLQLLRRDSTARENGPRPREPKRQRR